MESLNKSAILHSIHRLSSRKVPDMPDGNGTCSQNFTIPVYSNFHSCLSFFSCFILTTKGPTQNVTALFLFIRSGRMFFIIQLRYICHRYPVLLPGNDSNRYFPVLPNNHPSQHSHHSHRRSILPADSWNNPEDLFL